MGRVTATFTTAFGNGKGGRIGGTITATVAALVVTALDAAEQWGVNHLVLLTRLNEAK